MCRAFAVLNKVVTAFRRFGHDGPWQEPKWRLKWPNKTNTNYPGTRSRSTSFGPSTNCSPTACSDEMTPALDVLTKALYRASLDETPRETATRLISVLSAAGYSISQTR